MQANFQDVESFYNTKINNALTEADRLVFKSEQYALQMIYLRDNKIGAEKLAMEYSGAKSALFAEKALECQRQLDEISQKHVKLAWEAQQAGVKINSVEAEIGWSH